MALSVNTLTAGFLIAALGVGCGSGTPAAKDPMSPTMTARNWYRPSVQTQWQWQLLGTVNTNYDVTVYDIDAQLDDASESSADLISALQRQSRKVICYFSAGSSENWRADFNRFNESDMGKPLDGWEGERWLDVRSDNVRKIILDRLDVARAKGCDGVEPDNVDGYANKTGFDLTKDDQLRFNRFLAVEAHRRGLSVGLKNDGDQVKDLVDDFDFSVNEECHAYNECETLLPFVDAGKPVFNVEYTENVEQAHEKAQSICSAARGLDLRTLILPLELDDSFRVSCDDL